MSDGQSVLVTQISYKIRTSFRFLFFFIEAAAASLRRWGALTHQESRGSTGGAAVASKGAERGGEEGVASVSRS